MFHQVHFVEKWGRGIDLILSEEPDADFKVVADIFITTFKRRNYKADIPNTHPTTGKKTGKKNNKNVLNKIIDLVKKNPSISIKELSKLTGLSFNGVRYHLNTLKSKGILRRIGPDKGGHWEISG